MRLDALRVGRQPRDDVNVVVERILYTPMRYPGNYGFVPHALCGDARAARESHLIFLREVRRGDPLRFEARPPKR